MGEHFSDFTQLLAYLESKNQFHADLSLCRMRSALHALELKNPPFRLVQVVGTNGKGSTATFLATLATAHGLKCGLYTSPHFVTPRERIRINGSQVPEATWAQQASHLVDMLGTNNDLTYFEFITLLSLLIFREQRVEMAVLEAGLGGAHDATTAVSARYICFTPIALDHLDILGPELEDIAGDKALAITRDAHVLCGPQEPVVENILRARALSMNASFTPLTQETEAWAMACEANLVMPGQHQRENAALATLAWRKIAGEMNLDSDDPTVRRALGEARIAGRLQCIPAGASMPEIVLDGAHNPHGMRALLTALKDHGSRAIRPRAIIFSCLRDKDWPCVARMLAAEFPDSRLLLVNMGTQRAETMQNVVKILGTLAGKRTEIFSGSHAMEHALESAARLPPPRGCGRTILITGSLYLLGEFYRLYPEAVES